MLTVLGGLAEFEREVITARTSEGRARANEAGKRMGRPYQLTLHQRQEARQRREAGESLVSIAPWLWYAARLRPEPARGARDQAALQDEPKRLLPSAAHPILCGLGVRLVSGRMATTGLLLTGVTAVAVYALGDLVSGLLYEGYSFRDQAISELSAFGSPVRPLMMTVILIHGALLVAFGVGVIRAADRRSLRWTGALLIGACLVTFPTHTVWAMSSRGMETGFNDTMHALTTVAFSLLVGGAILASAIADGGWFRPFALIVLALLIGFGWAAGDAMGGLAENHTPWAGGFERINAYAYFAWIVALAMLLMRQQGRPALGSEAHL